MDLTLEMKVDNIGILVDLLGRDCAPLQYVRELTQNAIEAIGRAGRAEGHIVWESDSSWSGGVPKLSITDNGDGMTGEEMVRYINTLSCNGNGRQSLNGNYGIGAKIAAATKNPYGLVYMSWKNGDSSVIQMIQDRKGRYGLMSFDGQDESGYVADIEDDDQPEHVAKSGSGTKIVLMGTGKNDPTCAPPEGSSSKGAQWVRRYLNTRYFSFPANIRIQCQEYTKSDGGGLRPVTGQGPMLDAVALLKGEVALKDAIVHWWALPESTGVLRQPWQPPGAPKAVTTMDTLGPSHLNRGHVALLWRNELYDLREATTAYHPKLHQCGIFYGLNRIVLYFEPTSKDITANTPRTKLILHGEDPPWNDWAAEFRTKFPKELQDFIDSLSTDEVCDTTTIKSRIEEVLSLFNVSKYRIDSAGTEEVDDADEPAPIDSSSNSDPDSTPGPKQKRKPHLGSTRKLKPKGHKAKPFSLTDLPNVLWKFSRNGTRSPGEMEDKAAQFEPCTNTLFINGDFRGFICWIKFFVDQYPDNSSARKIITEELTQWWGQTLLEAVVTYQDYSSSPHWVSTLPQLTEEALTLAVLPRYHLHTALKRAVHNRLGKPTSTASAPMSVESYTSNPEATPVE
jgi:hypothetical protein